MQTFGRPETTALNRFFPHKVCINLDRRPERWARITGQFDRHGIAPVLRIPAVDGRNLAVPPDWMGPPEAYGCLQSHLKAVRLAQSEHWPWVLILEDDVVFDDDLNEKFAEYIGRIPDDWDMISFGCNHLEEPVKIAPGVAKLSNSFSTYATALKQTVYDAFIEINERSRVALDLNNRILQNSFHCYCFMPHLAWVEAGYSDILGLYCNHWFLQESRPAPEAAVAEALAQRTALILAYQDRGAEGVAWRNLLFQLEHLSLKTEVVIVEHQTKASIDPAALPPRCRYLLVEDQGLFDKGKCFNRGFRALESEKDLFVFSSDAHFLGNTHLLLNLERTDEFDFISLYEEAIMLNQSESSYLLEHDRIDDDSGFQRVSFSNMCEGPCLFTKRGFLAAGGWPEDGPLSDVQLAEKVQRSLPFFRSPGSIIRLFQDPHSR